MLTKNSPYIKNYKISSLNFVRILFIKKLTDKNNNKLRIFSEF